MSFYHPEILYGLFAVAIPLIIHLFNFKRFKKVYFTNVRFLRNVQQQSKRHSQWRHLLVLISRMLVVAFLVVAFARPFIPVGNQSKSSTAANYVNIFVDNSFSMESQAAEGNLLDQARKKAREIALAYQPSDNFRLLLNNNFPASNRFVNRDEFLNLLDEVQVEPASLPFSRVIEKVRTFDFQGKMPTQELFLISDFQKSQADIDAWKTDTNLQIHLLPLLAAARDNVYLDSCWFESPVLQSGKQLKLHYRIHNASMNDVEKIPLSLIINGQQKALAALDLKAGETSEHLLSFRLDSAGNYHGRIEIKDYPVTYDDRFYFGFSISDKVKVLSVKGKNASDAIELFYGRDSTFSFFQQPENRIDYSAFPAYDVVILNELQEYSTGLLLELKKYVQKQGALIIIPSNSEDIAELNKINKTFDLPAFQSLDTTRSQMAWMDVESNEFNDVFELEKGKFKLPDNIDMPWFRRHYLLPAAGLPLIKFEDASPLLLKFRIGDALLYEFMASFASQNSNISAHALFVPVMYNLALQGEKQGRLYYFTGRENMIPLINHTDAGREQLYKIKSLSSDFEFIPGIVQRGGGVQLVCDESSVQNAGNYKILLNDKEIQTCAFNYPRAESNLRPLSRSDIEAGIAKNHLKNINILDSGNASITAEIKDFHKGVQLWKLFLTLALLFLIIELLLLRFMK